MSDENKALGYPDLDCPDYVFEALLGYGMFTSLLPPCFTSEYFFQYARGNDFEDRPIYEHGFIEYRASRNTNVPRQCGIPHPKTYWKLCLIIRDYWQEINNHIGQSKKFNYCHVRKLKDRKHIFEMNYGAADKLKEEEKILDFSLGRKYYVRADISQCFPSIYSHSFSWAVKGKDKSKTKQEKNNKGCWLNQLDQAVRNVKDGETNGLLVGPHASNVISEIILSQVDLEIQKHNFYRVIRHIDDYQYFASDEQDAKKFIRTLSLTLKKYELALNEKKTKIIKIEKWPNYHWKHQLGQHSLMSIKCGSYRYTTIDSFVEFALRIMLDCADAAPLKYAIKVIRGKKLEPRAQRLYVKKILQLSILYPYLLPLIEENVFLFKESDFQEQLDSFLPSLLKTGVGSGGTDSISFCFYFAMKYDVEICDAKKYAEGIIELYDCITILLAFKYYEKFLLHEPANKIKDWALSLNDRDKRVRDQFWLLLYELLDENELTDDSLATLKKANVTFVKAKFGSTP